MIHGGANVWGKALFPPVHLDFDLRIPIFAVAAGVILIAAGTRLGLGGDEKLTDPLDGSNRDAHGPEPA
jgi:hypothetical protein